ncbi:unnamed protein product [Paramecium sonneborni]|uniref:Transmembrane protein n=1 Tax=Paramecium sonneborni TaxID=65129 RepID=A0A8S1LMR9_9CILI|nr:unnamed protein product [Paramecium sonneborni]
MSTQMNTINSFVIWMLEQSKSYYNDFTAILRMQIFMRNKKSIEQENAMLIDRNTIMLEHIIQIINQFQINNRYKQAFIEGKRRFNLIVKNHGLNTEVELLTLAFMLARRNQVMQLQQWVMERIILKSKIHGVQDGVKMDSFKFKEPGNQNVWIKLRKFHILQLNDPIHKFKFIFLYFLNFSIYFILKFKIPIQDQIIFIYQQYIYDFLISLNILITTTQKLL